MISDPVFLAWIGLVPAVAGLGLWLRRIARARAVARAPTNRRARPSFLWQGTLIILPVLGLSVLGFLATYRDYTLTEQEARQRAAEVARNLASDLGDAVGAELSRVEQLGDAWQATRIAGATVPQPGTVPSPGSDEGRNRERLGNWLSTHPGFRPEDVFPVRVELTASGSLSWPREYGPPQPPAWTHDLTEEQTILWDKLVHAGEPAADATTIRTPLGAFLATGITGPARTNAEYIGLLADLEAQPPTDRIEPLVRFAEQQSDGQSESGLPLATVVLARALRESETSGLSLRVFEELARQTDDLPSFLTARLLANAERLAARQTLEFQQAVRELHGRWHSQERLLGLSRQVLAVLAPTGVLVTNLWLDGQGIRWLAILSPANTATPTPTNTATGTVDGQPIHIRFFPKALVQLVVERAVDSTRLTIPSYLQVDTTLEGEPLRDSGPTSAGRQPERLARAETRLSWVVAPDAEPEAGKGAQPDLRQEALLSHPRLEFMLCLADPALLYAHARQRAIVFGGVVLGGLATALVGLSAAYRCFHRQLRLSEMKSNFVASVSHELRAPIASVRLLAESLDRGKVTDESKRREYFRLIGRECRRLSSMIENVLDFSRVEQGRQRYEFEPTDVVGLVAQAVDLMRPYAAERAVTLQFLRPAVFELEPCLDGKAIQQALVNLMDNAVKHSPAGATVDIALGTRARTTPRASENAPGPANPRSPDQGKPASAVEPSCSSSGPNSQSAALTLTVTDRGPGIPADECRRIFEPFYRRGSELRRETQGVGIGLSLVQHTVQAHGGRVWAESEVGKGSRFVIELPARHG